MNDARTPAVLPDPRSFPAHIECARFERLLSEAQASHDSRARAGPLYAVLRQALHDRDDELITHLFASARSAARYQLLHEVLAQAVDPFEPDEDAVVARGFALPIVLIAAARAVNELPGSLADVSAIRALFEERHVLGGSRNFGIGNALCGLSALERLLPSRIFHALRAFDVRSIDGVIAPMPIPITPHREEVHLRFLIGASITSAHAPSFTEQAAHVGRWASPFASLLKAELARPDVEMLVLPRVPRDLIRAAHAGRSAQLETAFNLFVGNAVRKFRLQAGDPCVIISAHDDADIRVSLSSPFTPELTDGFRWPLHPLDDIDGVVGVMRTLFTDARVNDVRLLPTVLPARRESGVILHPRCDEHDELSRHPRWHWQSHR